MTDAETTVSVRMYNVGFGDAFRIAVRRGDYRWTMLVDCGVHTSGQARSISESVDQIIADLRADSTDGSVHLDVVVATHHHRDHISGFAESQWEDVTVDEVWLPFVENEHDPDTVKLSGRLPLDATAQRLLNLLGPPTQFTTNKTLCLAQALTRNCSINQTAMNRLLGQNGEEFAGVRQRRFLPDVDPANNTIVIGPLGITAHILGPSRDEAMLKRMNSPKRAGWLTLDDADIIEATDKPDPLFSPDYVVPEDAFGEDDIGRLRRARDDMKLQELTGNDEGLLVAAALLERSVNNTSLFFVLEVGGLTFLFPGDAQYGAWEHVRGNPATKALIDNVDFYKVGHHGSHNATPGTFAKADWIKPGDAMIPWGNVKIWADTIPWQPLLDDLSTNQHLIVLPGDVREPERGDAHPSPTLTYDETGRWWTELTYRVQRRVGSGNEQR